MGLPAEYDRLREQVLATNISIDHEPMADIVVGQVEAWFQNRIKRLLREEDAADNYVVVGRAFYLPGQVVAAIQHRDDLGLSVLAEVDTICKYDDNGTFKDPRRIALQLVPDADTLDLRPGKSGLTGRDVLTGIVDYDTGGMLAIGWQTAMQKWYERAAEAQHV